MIIFIAMERNTVRSVTKTIHLLYRRQYSSICTTLSRFHDDVVTSSSNNVNSTTKITSAVETWKNISQFQTKRSIVSVTNPRLWKVAVVGSGPSGCYTAKYIQSSFGKKYNIVPTIDIIERLPVPYGLVRYGVAPDHPEVKNVQNDFDLLFDNTSDKTKAMQFYGNVNVGHDISLSELRSLYDIVVLAYGCESDRKLNIPGEQLDGILSAREFVAWYNGHPDFVHIGEKVAEALGVNEIKDNGAVRDVPVVVIGQGNVALDCARILAKGSKGLFHTDLASHTLPVLGNGVSQISVIGRRGHVQGAFTIKELRELIKLEEEGHETSFVVQDEELQLGTTDASKEELAGSSGRPKSRIDLLLREAATKEPNLSLPKRINLRFLLNPSKFEADVSNDQTVGSVVCERTKLEGDAGKQKAVGTGQYETLPAKLVLVSIGYKANVMPDTEPWFDTARGTLKNVRGKIDVPDPSTKQAGLYTSGWLKRGPSGIIGTNIVDAKDTVASIMKDIDEQILQQHTNDNDNDDNTDLRSILTTKGVQYIDWDGYRKIEQNENSIRRRSDEQPREKITNIEEMIQIAKS